MDILGIVLAGGKGERLYPLTQERAKPAVPIGGKYRLIDFVLSNFANSGIESIYVLTQFKAQSLMRHLEEAWRVSDFRNDRFLTVVPAQMRVGGDWYQGTADAVYQNLNLIERHRPELVAVFGADHIYRMNVQQMIDHHRAVGADVSVAVLPVDIEMATNFGIVEVDDDWRVRAFDEKPAAPKAIPGEPSHALVSMGNYVFNSDLLIETLRADAKQADSRHDFGSNILPSLVASHNLSAYDFHKNRVPLDFKGEEASYWRDVGTLESYYEANMDLRAISPSLNLYNRSWPIRTLGYGGPPPKFVFDAESRTGVAINSIVAEGTIISGSKIYGSIIGQHVRIHSYCHIEDSIIMDWVEIGRGCRIKNAIIDKFNTLVPGTEIGYDREKDRQRYTVAGDRITVMPRAAEKNCWTTIGWQ
ncbi:MAG: glucose-1-phosphate adenylyltransferase [Deltaproteobacteria bacterium]|nr:glucose-1-phosphate adenylyltransferase [Deltaproteobacteria bacterium]MDZ4345610.1 glucose-1-phosphate adenylyltransferase [Candidatus Binatia bacterium]